MVIHPEVRNRFTGVEKTEIAKLTLSYEDIFSLNHFLMLLREMLIENGYAPLEEEDFPENFYLERVNPIEGKEIVIFWRLKKTPKKEQKFFSYWLDIDLHITGLKDIEILFKGERVRTTKGKIEIALLGNLVIDYKGTWLDLDLVKPFRNLIFNAFFKKSFEGLIKKFSEEIAALREGIKDFLRVEAYIPEKELPIFHAKKRI